MSNIVVHCCLNMFEGVIGFCFIVFQTNTNCLPFIAARIESRQAEEMLVTAQEREHHFISSYLGFSFID